MRGRLRRTKQQWTNTGKWAWLHGEIQFNHWQKPPNVRRFDMERRSARDVRLGGDDGRVTWIRNKIGIKKNSCSLVTLFQFDGRLKIWFTICLNELIARITAIFLNSMTLHYISVWTIVVSKVITSPTSVFVLINVCIRVFVNTTGDKCLPR